MLHISDFLCTFKNFQGTHGIFAIAQLSCLKLVLSIVYYYVNIAWCEFCD